jgi:hypothetical protein
VTAIEERPLIQYPAQVVAVEATIMPDGKAHAAAVEAPNFGDPLCSVIIALVRYLRGAGGFKRASGFRSVYGPLPQALQMSVQSIIHRCE